MQKYPELPAVNKKKLSSTLIWNSYLTKSPSTRRALNGRRTRNTLIKLMDVGILLL